MASLLRHLNRSVGAARTRMNVGTSSSRMAAVSVGSVRYLNLHEYQSKDLLKSHGVTVQKGKMADTPSAAKDVAEWILKEAPEAELVIKAQIHAGGRGKGTFTNGFKGGVHLTRSSDKAVELVKNMLGNSLVTEQTGPEGQLVQKILINEAIDIKRETYIAILMDRKYGGPVIVSSQRGGMDIEEVAEKEPEALHVEPVDIEKGIQPEQAARIAEGLGFIENKEDAMRQIEGLYNLFIATDATQVEINPLAETPEGKVYAVDAKLNFDDNASFRQKDLFAMRDVTMEDPKDVEAEEAGLNYVALDGNIGCMVNGAGLAMATMDIIQLHGGMPANFLDVGGGATSEQVSKAFKILTADPKVQAILINIFGGIMQCDTIANGIIAAHKEVGLNVPLCVRLAGSNMEKGQKLLAESGLPIIVADDLDDAAEKAVRAAHEANNPQRASGASH